MRCLLQTLKERENVFELKLAQLPGKEQEYFRRRYNALRAFLNEAIARNTPIDTSL